MPALLNREEERAVLNGLLEDLRSGRGRVLVVRGEAGVGKSALLEYATGAAADMRVIPAAGVESEMELAFASLHQLCGPLLDRLADLPAPQRDALQIAFGLRAGAMDTAREAMDLLTDRTRAGGTEEGLGVEARCRALLSAGQAADECHREAIDQLSRTALRTELARTHLLYGEWLRGADRRADARAQLRTAHDMFTAIGMEAFAERARHELLAAGETVRTRSAGPHHQLTPQETQIARLARGGLSNPEIAAQLFLSPRTVEYHLRKVFTKLDIASRRQLRQALP